MYDTNYKSCIKCPTNYVYDSNSFQCILDKSSSVSGPKSSDECKSLNPYTPFYDGKSCVSCYLPRYWNLENLKCEDCPSGNNYDINTKSCRVCPNGQTYDFNKFVCAWLCSLTHQIYLF